MLLKNKIKPNYHVFLLFSALKLEMEQWYWYIWNIRKYIIKKKKILTEKKKVKCYPRNLFYDQKSPSNPVSESMGGCTSITLKAGRQTKSLSLTFDIIGRQVAAVCVLSPITIITGIGINDNHIWHSLIAIHMILIHTHTMRMRMCMSKRMTFFLFCS